MTVFDLAPPRCVHGVLAPEVACDHCQANGGPVWPQPATEPNGHHRGDESTTEDDMASEDEPPFDPWPDSAPERSALPTPSVGEQGAPAAGERSALPTPSVAERGAPTEQPDDLEPPLYADVAGLLAGTLPEPPQPLLLTRQDGHALFYANAVNVLFGDPESGKSWVALAACAEALRNGRRVLVVDADHNGPTAMVSRLVQLGAPVAALSNLDLFRYTEPLDRDHLRAVVADSLTWRPAVAVVDSVGELLPLLGLSSNNPDDYTVAHRSVLLGLKRAGAAVIAVDHLAKNTASRTFGPTGTAAKKRTADGASLRVTLRDQFAPGRGGCCALSVHKDRNGGLRAHCPNTGSTPAPAGLFRLTSHDDGSLSWSVSTPTLDDADPPEDGQRFDPEADADQLAALNPPPDSQRDVQNRMRWGGTRALAALRVLRERSAGAVDSAPRSATPVSGSAEHSRCTVCGDPLTPTEDGQTTHPLCQPELTP